MKRLISSTLLLLSALSANGESCVTLDGSAGNCVQVFNCPVLLNIVRGKQQTPEQIALLRKSACGFEVTIPKVCCPRVCVTSDGEHGSCVARGSCPHLSKITEAKSCMGSENVCCPPLNTEVPIGNCENILNAFPFPEKSYCCGRDSVTDLKISYSGGYKLEIDQYPWLALIEYRVGNKTKLSCGGTLISGKYVLTAARCISRSALNYGTPTGVRLGEYDTSNEMDCAETRDGDLVCSPATVTIPVESIIPHPLYDPHTRRNDIGLIRLKELAPYTDFIKPICLPTKDSTVENLSIFDLFVAGWGTSSQTSMVKQDISLKFVELKDCQKLFSTGARNVTLWSGQVCAGGEIGKSACRGSPGGPLMHRTRGAFEAIGVISFGAKCRHEELPTVFTKVYEYIDWIYSVIEH